MKAGWETKPLGEVCDVIGGGTPSKDKAHLAFYSGGIRWATVRDMKKDLISDTEFKITKEAVKSSATNIIPKGNVVIATRVGLGKVCLIEHDTAINQDLRGIVPKNSAQLIVPFLFWWLKSVALLIIKAGTGATVQGVKLPFIKALPLPIPSLSEQQRIVTILEEAFEGIATATANAENNLSNARQVYENALELIFSNYDADWKLNHHPLSDLCDLIVDCEHKTAPKQAEGIPSIRTPNIGKGKLLLDGVYRVSEITYKEWTRRAEPIAGDLIFAREAPAGNVAVVPSNLKVCLGQRTVLIRPKRTVFEPDFLAFLMLSRPIQRRLLDHSRGATVQHVNMKDIRALKFAVIPPIQIQQKIVLSLNELSSQVEELESVYQQKLDALAELKKSILHQAFTGQLQ